MRKPGKTTKKNVTPAKLVVVAILAVVLVVVVVVQFSGGDTSNTSSERPSEEGAPTSSPAEKANGAGPSPAQQDAVQHPRPVWKKIPREEVVKHDPFALPEALVPEVGAEPSQQGQEADAPATVSQQRDLERRQREAFDLMQREGVGIVLRRQDEWVAKIGSRSVRIGDVMDGFRVIDIGPQGVVLERYDDDAQ